LAALLATLAVGGCAGWSSTPERLDANYGASVRAMVYNQIADPDKAQHPASLAPDGLEGVKAGSVLEQAYRKDLGKPELIRQHNSNVVAPGLAGSSGR
jgi:hypothetical protein